MKKITLLIVVILSINSDLSGRLSASGLAKGCLPSNCKIIGPYEDNHTQSDDNRALNYGPKSYGYTFETCRAACPTYKYFALQNGTWEPPTAWCSCTNS